MITFYRASIRICLITFDIMALDVHGDLMDRTAVLGCLKFICLAPRVWSVYLSYYYKSYQNYSPCHLYSWTGRSKAPEIFLLHPVMTAQFTCDDSRSNDLCHSTCEDQTTPFKSIEDTCAAYQTCCTMTMTWYLEFVNLNHTWTRGVCVAAMMNFFIRKAFGLGCEVHGPRPNTKDV